MQANLYGQDANGAWVPLRVGETGQLVGASSGGSNLPKGQTSTLLPWSYVAASGGITNTSAVTLVAAPGVGKANFVTAVQLLNSSGTATEVVISSGSTVLWRVRVGASMIFPVSVSFVQPLIGGNNEALTATCATGSTATYINAQGYTDLSLAGLQASLTANVEIFDEAGAQIFDAASNPIYLAA